MFHLVFLSKDCLLCSPADRVATLGMAVALTTTVNLIFGSLVMDPVTGVLFNDEVRLLVLLPLIIFYWIDVAIRMLIFGDYRWTVSHVLDAQKAGRNAEYVL